MTPAGPDSPRGAHAWHSATRRWDLYFGTVLVLTEAFLLLAHGVDGPRRYAAAGLLLLDLPLYLAAGRPALLGDRDNSRRAVAAVAGTALVVVGAAVLSRQATVAMFALGPLCFMLLSLPPAVLVLLVANFLPLAAWCVQWHDRYDRILTVTIITLVLTAFSLAFGSWVHRILAQSVERAELIRQLDESREEVARLSAAHGALAERERLAREIHDTLAQGFTSLVMLGQAVEGELDRDPEQARRHVALMQRTARENLAESRALVAALTPAQLGSGSLPDAVRRLAERHADEFGGDADVRVSGRPRPLPPAVEVVALRACQEALSNVRKHAAAGRVDVGLRYGGDDLAVTVTDDGRGFDPSAAAGSGGYGLPGMRARAAEIGGTAAVDSAAGAGTVLTVRLPAGGTGPGPGGPDPSAVPGPEGRGPAEPRPAARDSADPYPAGAPPADSPAGAPPADAPPVDIPPADSPPTDTPPADSPPTDTPPATAAAPATAAPSPEDAP